MSQLTKYLKIYMLFFASFLVILTTKAWSDLFMNMFSTTLTRFFIVLGFTLLTVFMTLYVFGKRAEKIKFEKLLYANFGINIDPVEGNISI